MDSDPLRRARRTHTNGWMTALALGLLAAGFLACLYILIGVPAQAQAVGDSTTAPAPSAPPSTAPLYRRQQPRSHRGRAQSRAFRADVPIARRYRRR